MAKLITITIDESQGVVFADKPVKIDVRNIDDPIYDCKADLISLFACKYIADLMRLPYDELRRMRLEEIEDGY